MVGEPTKREAEVHAFVVSEEPTGHATLILGDQAVTKIWVDLLVFGGFGAVCKNVVRGYGRLELQHYARKPDFFRFLFKETEISLKSRVASLWGADLGLRHDSEVVVNSDLIQEDSALADIQWLPAQILCDEVSCDSDECTFSGHRNMHSNNVFYASDAFAVNILFCRA